jgi:hypothetical protein
VDHNNNLKENLSDINDNLEIDLDMDKLKKELKKSFDDYQTTMRFMLADAPIESLCLNPKLEAILLNEGFLRIYDLFNVDLVKVKGLGVVRIKELTTRLDQFFSML